MQAGSWLATQEWATNQKPDKQVDPTLVVIVKSCVNKQAGSWLAAQEWTTNQRPGQQVDLTLDNEYNS